jgi:hypothetical protein
MASKLLTRPITREKLARIFPNQEAIKLMENLTKDVGDTLASESDSNTQAIDDAAASAMVALQCAASAKDSAAIAESLAREVAALLQTIRTQASDISNLRRDVEDLRALIQGT